MEVEDVAGVRLTARRAAQQQRDLAVGVGLLGEVVVDDEGVLAVLHPVLAHRAARVGREVLERRRLGGGRGDDDGVLEGAVLLEGRDDLGDRRALLADGDVDALHAGAALVDDRVDGDRRLAGLAVADDELPLAAADRRDRVDDLDAGLQRLGDRLACDDARRLDLEAAQRRSRRAGPCRRSARRAGSRPGRGARRRPGPTGSGRSSGRPGPRRAPRRSPSTTAPIDSSSRLRARPTTPFSNSSSSLTDAPGSPVTRAMPSPTSAMRPTCSAATSVVKLGDVARERSGDVVGVDGQLCHWCVPRPSRRVQELLVDSGRAEAAGAGGASDSRSRSRRWRTVPSMTSVADRDDIPPTTAGSTITRTSTGSADECARARRRGAPARRRRGRRRSGPRRCAARALRRRARRATRGCRRGRGVRRRATQVDEQSDRRGLALVAEQLADDRAPARSGRSGGRRAPGEAAGSCRRTRRSGTAVLDLVDQAELGQLLEQRGRRSPQALAHRAAPPDGEVLLESPRVAGGRRGGGLGELDEVGDRHGEVAGRLDEGGPGEQRPTLERGLAGDQVVDDAAASERRNVRVGEDVAELF